MFCSICHHWFVEIRLTLDVTLRNSLESLWLYVFSSMNERCTLMTLRESLQKWMSFMSASWYFIVSGVLESCHALERWQQFHWLGNSKHSLTTTCVLVHFSDQSELICLSTWSEFLWSLWGSCKAVCAFECFDEVRSTEAWKHNPLVPSVLYFALHKGTCFPMMGDVVLGWKLPQPM
jgi:hypothetical protein